MKKRRVVVVALLFAIAVLACVLICVFGKELVKPDDLPSVAPAAMAEADREAEAETGTEPELLAEEDAEEEEEPEEEEAEEDEEENKVAKQNSGISLSGTSASNSFDIKMSDSYTFSDPVGLSFGTRYVLYGGSGCMFAKTASAQGYSCIGGYEVLYASGSSPVCEYRFYVMSSASDAAGLASHFANYYNGGGTSCGYNGDVVYIYYSGSYVQDTINVYYDQGAIDSRSVKAYLRIPFFFNGMSAYTGGDVPQENQPEEQQPEVNQGEPPAPLPTPSEGDEKFSLKVTDSYTFTDPEGLSFDTRYVLSGGADCTTAATVAKTAGVSVDKVYDILYTKDGEPAAEYQIYVTGSDAEAKAVADLYQNGWTAVGNVVVSASDAEMVRQMISYLTYVGVEPTVPGYLQYLMTSGGLSNYSGTEIPPATKPEEKPEPVNPDPTPVNPDPKPVDPTPEPVFELKDPAGLEYDTRYILSGDSSNGFAAQCGAEKVYIVFYAKDGAPLGQYMYYVMDSAASAESLAAENEGWTVDANAACTNYDGAYVQDYVNIYAQYGMIAEATLDAYVQLFVNGYKMTVEDTILPGQKPVDPDPEPVFELKDPAGLDYDTRYILSGNNSNNFATQYGADKVYVVFYAKDGSPLGQYMYYVMDSAASAESLAAENEGWTIDATDDKVACFSYDGESVQGTIDSYAQFMSEATLDAYVHLYVSGYGLTLEDTILPGTNPEPGPEADPKAIKLSDSYTFTDPEGLAYETRYVLHGDSTSAMAKPVGAQAADVILYVKDGKPVSQYEFYVMADAETATQLATRVGAKTIDNIVYAESDGAKVSAQIESFVSNGVITEATVEAYVAGYTEMFGLVQTEDTILPEPAATAVTFSEPAGEAPAAAAPEQPAAEAPATETAPEQPAAEAPVTEATPEQVEEVSAEPVEEASAEPAESADAALPEQPVTEPVEDPVTETMPEAALEQSEEGSTEQAAGPGTAAEDSAETAPEE